MTLSERVTLVSDLAHLPTRADIWTSCISRFDARTILELGVWKGEFAESLLKACSVIERLYLLDSWRNLETWNKPWNVDEETFRAVYEEAMDRTQIGGDRCVRLRGTTMEVIDQIPDGSLDLAYVDGDHTLRGISIDLIKAYPKVRPGGILGGDDYTPTIWQHSEQFEPSLVCPFAAYFAESQNAPLIILPFGQFAILKPLEGEASKFQVIDTTGSYGPRNLVSQVKPRD
ncbi:MAG: class I SAM-dependent methyltransferase [Mesorhizobium sp.]|nr:MAG: class I SAM-dependent methyltransferase [Mesorhizobium sp.]